MHAVVPIPKSVTDIYYVYRRPLLQTKTVGSGHQKLTVIKNLAQIGNRLQWEPTVVAHAIGFFLGQSIAFDDATSRCTLKDELSLEILEDALEAFIGKYAVCPRCGIPELCVKPVKTVGKKAPNTVAKKTKNEFGFTLQCQACGDVCDPPENEKRLNKFIQDKTPPIAPKEKPKQTVPVSVQNLTTSSDDDSGGYDDDYDAIDFN